MIIHTFFRYQLLLICLLFTGGISLTAQTTGTPQKLSKQCLQKMKLVSDKIVLTSNNFEQPIQSEIIIDPSNSEMKIKLQELNKKDEKTTIYIIEKIQCDINESMTSGNVIYTVRSSNNDGSYSSWEFILKTTKEGLIFSNTIDSPENTAIVPISKYEIIK